MEIQVTYGKERIHSDILIVDYFLDTPPQFGERFVKEDTYFDLVNPAFLSKDFSGDWKQTNVIYSYGKIPEDRVLLVGLGDQREVTPFKIKVSFAHALKKIRNLQIKHVSTFIDNKYDSNKVQEMVSFLVEAAYMSQYHQPSFKKEPVKHEHIEKLHFILSEGVNEDEVKKGIFQGSVIGKSINLVRDLINKPGNEMTPSFLAKSAENMAKRNPTVQCEVFDYQKLVDMKMGGIVNVGKGSSEKPCMVVAKYTPKKEGNYRTVALVGKGVTFDSGGISLKPSKNMHLMKNDMSGAALVIGIMEAASILELPIKILGVIPTCENMPDGNSMKPGDIIRAYDGQYVEILDTDCEGRMILMDALGYANEQKPDLIVDLATLTGACIIALGRYVMGGMTNYQPVMDIMTASGDYMYERVWQLPLMEEYELMLKSKYADIKNYAGREAGAITAGAFLSNFVGDTPWIHLDIAGVVWFDSETSLMPEGASGIGVRLIIDFMQRLLAKDCPELWEKGIKSIRKTIYQEDEVPKPPSDIS